MAHIQITEPYTTLQKYKHYMHTIAQMHMVYIHICKHAHAYVHTHTYITYTHLNTDHGTCKRTFFILTNQQCMHPRTHTGWLRTHSQVHMGKQMLANATHNTLAFHTLHNYILHTCKQCWVTLIYVTFQYFVPHHMI